jgi:hypothetical protein
MDNLNLAVGLITIMSCATASRSETAIVLKVSTSECEIIKNIYRHDT